MDILGLVKEQLTGAVIEKIGSTLGESTESTGSALTSAMPMLLGGLMQKGASAEGAAGIFDLIKNQGHDGDGILGNIGNLLSGDSGGDNASGLMSAGSGILSMILGDKIGGIANLISSVSGIKGSSASSLLSMAAPLLMGVVGKQVTSSNMGVSGLVSMLMGQKDSVMAALPAGADKLLGLGSLGNMMSDVKANIPNAGIPKVDLPDNLGGGGFNWKPWALLGLLALGAAYYFKSCRGGEKEATAVTTPAIDATATADTTASASGSIIKKLSSGVELNFGRESIENEVIGFIEDASKSADDKTAWFNFRGLQFDTGKSAIKPESMKEVENIVEIMKAYPNVNMKIGGYTDNVGSEASNMKLSTARAATVKSAIVAKGIDASRLDSEGYGPQFPVASNDTEEGRAQNRRIAVRITKK